MSDYIFEQAIHEIRSLASALSSPNESDSNGEVVNVVDGLYFIGRAIHRLATAVECVADPSRDVPKP